jgi:demethylmenaquinone methyltransferase/2-methoxy-6-polyprenyl-1,4-benzoquinol methylase
MKKASIPPPAITCIDFSEKMLDVAKKRLPASTSFITADASSLPCENASFDIVCMSFGYRNLVDKEHALMEIARVLKPHGRLFVLELTQPTSPIWASFHSIILRYIIPMLGKLLTGHIEPYKYLANSIENFSEPQRLEEFSKANLVCIATTKLSFGSCTLLEVAHV